MVRSRRRAHKGTTLLAIYAAASLVPVLALGVTLVRGYHDAAVTRALDQGRAQAAVIEQMAVSPAVRDADFDTGLTATETYQLLKATELATFHQSVLRLRLMAFDGTIVYADDGSTGSVDAADPGFRSAADHGDATATIVDAGDDSDQDAVIRVLVQVVPEATGRAVGVLEVHLPYDEIAEQVAGETRSAIIRLAIGLGVLYAVLGLISWWTTRALGRHAAAKEHQALHDPLTGLPNRDLFRRVAERAVERHQGRGALVLVDLDRFKEVNDTLGHHAGDELLQVVGRRLQESLRTDDTVARLGGDEFGILLPGESDRAATVELLTRVRAAVSAEITLDDSTLTVDASFGVCFFPDDADTVEDLLKNADAAMYHGKHGPTGVVVYEESAARPATDSLVLQRELRRAIADDQLLLQYQPKLHLASGHVSCVEALVRWQHPGRGLLPPLDFLPVAERSELIEPLTRWVLRQALTDCARWADAGRPWSVAVNVSARNLATLEFVDVVRETLAATAVPPERLYLEITETAVAFDAVQVREVVERLAGLGVSVSVDDFGVGYTGLSQLRAMSIREIKIDRAFIANLEHSQQDRAIVASVIDLAHGLGCTVTAEGVETQGVADWLADAGCDHGQGYLWLRPSPWQEIVPASEASGTAVPASPAP
jgi:diguanylate cyclase (GGDEF)-like protein